jgi:hypothetical protein
MGSDRGLPVAQLLFAAPTALSQGASSLSANPHDAGTETDIAICYSTLRSGTFRSLGG